MIKFSDKAASIICKAKETAIKSGSPCIHSCHVEAVIMNDCKNIFLENLDADIVSEFEDSLRDEIELHSSKSIPEKAVISKTLMMGLESVSRAGKITLGKLYSVIQAINFENESRDLDVSIVRDIVFELEELDEDSDLTVMHGNLPGQQLVDWHDFCTDLIEEAKSNPKPLIGRDSEVEDTIRVLLRHDKCNPVHIGEPGVGKTAITKGLAKRIVSGDVPEKLKNSELYSVDLAGMIAGTQYRGEFEQRLKTLIAGVKEECKRPILFFDEIHMIVGAGATGNSSMDASNILKPELTAGVIKFIGATTINEYRNCIEKDRALERRFQKVMVNEPSVEDCKKILRGVAPVYEAHHDVTFTDEALSAAVELSKKYINDRFLPDKAIDLIDEAGATRAAHPTKSKKIRRADIESVLERTCHIVITSDEDDMKKVKNLDANLSEKVFGQDDAIQTVTNAIKLSKSGLTDGDKPIASFLFVGPSGVGKTELTKQLANELEIPLIRFDMSEYQESHSVAKLTGAPAGYVGYEDGGILTEAVRKTPHCVVLFDEIEKAHPDIYKTFLQIMDYGMLTDNKGRKADFRNTVIIMTSNAGATVVNKASSIGFGKFTGTSINVDGIMDAVNNTFTPEFRNRLTKIVIFNGLNSDTARLVVKKELRNLSEKLKGKKINAKFSDEVIDRLVELGVSDIYGARSVQRAIDEYIRRLFVDAIISGENLSDCTVSKNANGEFEII